MLAAWRAARRPGETLVVAGLAGAGEDGVRFTGMIPPAEYRALLRRARAFVTAPRREDFGIAQLEALADGAQLVTTAAPGPYAALPLARALDPRLVGDDLAAAIRTALDDPSPGYAGARGGGRRAVHARGRRRARRRAPPAGAARRVAVGLAAHRAGLPTASAQKTARRSAVVAAAMSTPHDHRGPAPEGDAGDREARGVGADAELVRRRRAPA